LKKGGKINLLFFWGGRRERKGREATTSQGPCRAFFRLEVSSGGEGKREKGEGGKEEDAQISHLDMMAGEKGKGKKR